MRAHRLLALVLLAPLLAGCAYNTGTLMPKGVKRVAVQMFVNETRYRHVELTYTRVLTRELVERSYVSLRDPDAADAIIKGTILEIRRRPLIEGRRDEVLESSVYPIVRVEMVDAETGAPLIEPFLINSRRAEYIVPRGETLDDALDEVMEELARETIVRIEALSFLEVPFPADDGEGRSEMGPTVKETVDPLRDLPPDEPRAADVSGSSPMVPPETEGR